jgi:hypothetical protein
MEMIGVPKNCDFNRRTRISLSSKQVIQIISAQVSRVDLCFII